MHRQDESYERPLNDAEREMFRRLPRDRTPSPDLEEATTAELRRRGLLRPRGSRRVTRLAAMACAAAIVFAVGVVAGYQVGVHHAARTAQQTGAARAAESVAVNGVPVRRQLVWY